jgi:outer membrane protein
MKKAVVITVSVIAAMTVGAWLAGAQAPAPAPAPAQKVGSVDVQRVLARAQGGVAAREQLEREKATMQKEMDGRRVEIEKLKEEIEKKGPLMTVEVRRERQDLFERKRRDAARLADDLQKELEKKESGLLQKVLADLAGVIDRVGKAKGYLLVVERARGGVLYVAAEADLTDEVIRAYDQDLQSKGGKK